MNDEAFDRKIMIIMSLVGVALIINVTAYDIYQIHFSDDSWESTGEFVLHEIENYKELCSSHGVVRFYFYTEEEYLKQGDDETIKILNMTEENCDRLNVEEGEE